LNPRHPSRRQLFIGGLATTGTCTGVTPLLVAFFSHGDRPVSATVDDASILVSVGDDAVELTRAEADALRERLGDALAGTREFVHTSGQRRPDGSYVVARRNADSTGNETAFDGFADLVALYDGLPDRFTASDVDAPGISGSRRHLVVRHLAEHPRFDCRLSKRRPLTVEKHEGDWEDAGQKVEPSERVEQEGRVEQQERAEQSQREGGDEEGGSEPTPASRPVPMQ
jgi:hypothetical protein